MKKQLLFLIIVLSAITPYSFSQTISGKSIVNEQWKQIDSLLNLGLDQTAKKEIDKLFDDSKLSQKHSDFIKALSYKFRLNQKNPNPNQFITELKQEINRAKTPQLQILNSFLGDFCYDYYRNNRWKINQRTQLLSEPGEDIQNWSKNNFIERSQKYYLASLKDADLLYSVSIAQLKPVLFNDSLSEIYYPTLFDLLAQRAIKYFSENIQEPASDRDNNGSRFLIPTDKFLSLEIEIQNPADFQMQILKIYQSLVRMHQQHFKSMALAKAELKRLEYAFKAFHPQNQMAYLNALKELESKNSDHAVSAEINYEIAAIHASNGFKYHPFKNTEYRWDLVKALRICQQNIQKSPKTLGGKACSDLIKKIQNSELNLVLKQVNLPNEPILSSLTYKNLDKLHFRILRLNYLQNEALNQDLNNDEELKYYLALKPLFEWSKMLPNESDYQSHNLQLRIPEVEPGYYVLLASPDSDFHPDSLIHLNKFWSSNLSFIKRDDLGRAMDIFTLDRKTGFPKKDVKIDVQTGEYNFKLRKWKWKQMASLVSSSNGYIRINELIINESYRFILSKDNDTLVEKRVPNYGSLKSGSNKKVYKTQFFTDRSIYRPGQTVYFKGIVYLKEGDQYSVAPLQKNEITFFDVNHQKIKNITRTTNEYGSFNGEFIIPENVLNGQMLIKSNTGWVWISVEEYKRPNFEVVFDTLKSQYRLNDIVKITGKATTFSGAPLTNAKGKFSIKRSYYQLYYWFFSHPGAEQKQIAFGEFKTDEFGNFIFDFKALPDEEMSSTNHPAFNFRIEVELSDLNGETQKEETNLSLAYSDLVLETNLTENWNKDGNEFVEITAQNLRGQKQKVNVKVSVFRLKEPTQVFKKRIWKRPDYFMTDAETFYTYFPNDQYDNENDAENWEINHQIFQAEINTGEVNGVQLEDLKSWPSGKYKIILSSEDDYDTEVEVSRNFTLYASDHPRMPFPLIEFFILDNNKLNIGDKLSFIIGSGKENVRILYELQHKNRVVLSKWLNLKNEKQKINFPISKDLTGELTLNLLFIVDNETYSHQEQIIVSDPSRKLNISLETFRSVLKPGSKEDWKIKITGSKKEAVNAELLCTMMDASLDKLKPHTWNFSLQNYEYNHIFWNSNYGFGTGSGIARNQKYFPWYHKPKETLELRFYWEVMGSRMYMGRSVMSVVNDEIELDAEATETTQFEEYVPITNLKAAEIEAPQIRKNFSETTFFYPDLKTDKNGNISISFTSSEALSRWKFMALSHTKDLRIAQLTKEVLTQKELMVSPNIPRFFREGDTLYFSTKIINLTEEKLNGEVTLELFDAQTMKSIKDIILDPQKQQFTVAAHGSIGKQWKMLVPSGVQAITYRLIASSKNHSDGEERIIPVLPNQILVTESLPIHLNPKEHKKMMFDRLLNSANNKGIKQHHLKLEITSNPAWYAIQALPYVDEDQHENAISLYLGFYANSMASHLLNSNPKIKPVFDQWRLLKADALSSNLEKNQELKSVLLAETPWQTEAQNETERKRKLALFFDENAIKQKLNTKFDKLLTLQLPDGSWTWFKGMQGSQYITQFVTKGLIGLQSKNAIHPHFKKQVEEATKRAMSFLNKAFIHDYNQLKNQKEVNLEHNHLANLQIQHLFILSLNENLNLKTEEFEKVKAYYLSQVQKFWPQRSNYLQAMMALTLFRNGDVETAELILKSLKERAHFDNEMGMYWNRSNGYYWYQEPIETQAILIEAFNEISGDKEIVNQLKQWLIKQKQTQIWDTPKASVEAVNAILLDDPQLFDDNKIVEVFLGDEPIQIENVEAGTSYFQVDWSAPEIKPEMGRIELKNTNKQIAWGALHWQYFSNLDSVKASENALQISKQIFVKETGESGDVLKTVDANFKFKIGDKIVSRMVINVDRAMEFVHIKDMRAGAFEPIEVMSGYRYEGGVGFYKSHTDAASHYYFDYLRSGTYVFENTMFVTQNGSFSNGISTIQCLYAPEFNSHSKAIRVEVKK